MEYLESKNNEELTLEVCQTQESPNVDFSTDVTLTDDEGERIATMREYVFLNLASSGN